MAGGLRATALFSDANLQAYYEGENVNDSKNSNTLTNVGTVTFTPARFDNGFNLGTSNSSKALSVASALNVDGGNITISLWVKLLTEIGSGNYVFAYQFNDTSKVEFSINYEYNGGTRRLVFKRGRVGTADDTVVQNITLGTTDFYHLALTYNGGDLIGYTNNVSPGTTPCSGNGAAGSGDEFNIGAKAGASTQFASAIIDDVAVFDRTLNGTDIGVLYNAPLPTTDGGRIITFI